jgi:hypothetical protein
MELILVQQAKVVLYLWIATFGLFIMTSIVAPKKLSNWAYYIGGAMGIIAGGALNTYIANCVVAGQCTTYAWIMVAFAALYTVFYAFMLIMMLIGRGGGKGMSRMRSKKMR